MSGFSGGMWAIGEVSFLEGKCERVCVARHRSSGDVWERGGEYRLSSHLEMLVFAH